MSTETNKTYYYVRGGAVKSVVARVTPKTVILPDFSSAAGFRKRLTHEQAACRLSATPLLAASKNLEDARRTVVHLEKKLDAAIEERSRATLLFNTLVQQ